MNWKYFAMIGIPILRMAGESKKAEDENNSGKDDLIGVSLVYAADLLEALVSGKDKMPKVPDALK